MNRHTLVGITAAALVGGLLFGVSAQADEIVEAKPTAASAQKQRAIAAERASRSKGARLGEADLEERVAEAKRLEAERKAAEEKARAEARARAAAEKKKAEAAATAKKNKAVKTAPNYASGSTVWDRLAKCESGGNWAINTGNGYYGGLQFSLSSWRGVGGSGYPHQASRAEQIKRGQILQSRGGWGHWPACSKKLGLR